MVAGGDQESAVSLCARRGETTHQRVSVNVRRVVHVVHPYGRVDADDANPQSGRLKEETAFLGLRWVGPPEKLFVEVPKWLGHLDEGLFVGGCQCTSERNCSDGRIGVL